MSRRPFHLRARRALLAGAALILLGAAGPPVPFDAAVATHVTLEAAAAPHITLDASTPGDEESVEGDVDEVRLFFSDAPLMRGASIRIVNSSRKLVRSSPPEADAEDPKQLAVQIEPALSPGTYVVQWRCIADDGHVMRGSFSFDVVGR